MIENWVGINGFIGSYEVSDLGRVRSIPREVTYSDGRVAFYKGKLLSHGTCKKGYCCVVLSINGKCKTNKVHRLVAQAFLSNTGNKPCVNHIDSNPSNNDVNNLEWCTYSENTIYAYKIGEMVPKLGEDRSNSKLSEKDVLSIFKLKGVYSCRKVAKLYGVSHNVIHSIFKGESWKHLTVGNDSDRVVLLEEVNETTESPSTEGFKGREAK